MDDGVQKEIEAEVIAADRFNLHLVQYLALMEIIDISDFADFVDHEMIDNPDERIADKVEALHKMAPRISALLAAKRSRRAPSEGESG